jgi:hypothetical protein
MPGAGYWMPDTGKILKNWEDFRYLNAIQNQVSSIRYRFFKNSAPAYQILNLLCLHLLTGRRGR